MVLFFDLQRFADGGAGSGAGAPAGSGQAGPAQQQTQQADSPIAGAQTQTAGMSEAQFDELIKGEGKQYFDARVQKIIKDRFKNRDKGPEDAVQENSEATEEGPDDHFKYEQEALERGIPVEVVAKMHKLEEMEQQRKQQAQQAEQQQRIADHLAGLQQQGEQLKQIYPGFDLQTELNDPTFARLTAPGMGVDLRTAYEVVHRDQLRGAEMQYATQRTAQRMAAAVQSQQRRPSENGVARGSVATTQTNDPSRMSKEYLKQAIARAQGGERITWDKL